jgi:hypothetical protein
MWERREAPHSQQGKLHSLRTQVCSFTKSSSSLTVEDRLRQKSNVRRQFGRIQPTIVVEPEQAPFHVAMGRPHARGSGATARLAGSPTGARLQATREHAAASGRHFTDMPT